MCVSFFQHFLKNPTTVGAIVPLQGPVISEMVQGMKNRCDDSPWSILEVGAGFGNVSEALVKLLRPSDSLDLIEIDKECCAFLKMKYEDNPQIKVICSPILDWKPKKKYNLIVSTLPLNNFNLSTVHAVFDHFISLSTPPALCSYVEYIGLEKLKETFSEKALQPEFKKRHFYLDQLHKNHLISKKRVFLNFFPCNVYHLQLMERNLDTNR